MIDLPSACSMVDVAERHPTVVLVGAYCLEGDQRHHWLCRTRGSTCLAGKSDVSIS
jgi:hypothetical protein